MSNKMITPFLLIGFGLFSACEEVIDNPATPSPRVSASVSAIRPQNPAQLSDTLAGAHGRSWQLLTRREGDNTVTQDCYKDDQLLIYRDFSITFEIGKQACVIEGVPNKTQGGRWQPTTSLDILVFTGDQPPFPVRILSLDHQGMTVSFIDIDGKEVVESYRLLKELEPSAPITQPSGRPVTTPGPSPTPVILAP